MLNVNSVVNDVMDKAKSDLIGRCSVIQQIAANEAQQSNMLLIQGQYDHKGFHRKFLDVQAFAQSFLINPDPDGVSISFSSSGFTPDQMQVASILFNSTMARAAISIGGD